MTADHLIGIERFEAGLWKVADNLRANSNLASNEYFMPILGLIFLRHATNRYYAAVAAIEEDRAAGRMPDRPLVEADFTRRRALMLPEPARYDVLLGRPKDGNLGAAVTAAMDAVEDHFPPLAGQLPKDYERFEDDTLEEMMRTFDSEALRTASGDVFGRIYEYFLAEFSKEGAHDNGEFFTPPSIVQTIVNVIEPGHGVVLDPACGSGGMFVQSSHFIEDAGEDTMKRVTFYGHEKNETTGKLARINLAVHGLEGRIRAGNEAITYYKDPHELAGRCDFVMANPPFNVDEVDAEKVKGDRRLPFGLPGVNDAGPARRPRPLPARQRRGRRSGRGAPHRPSRRSRSASDGGSAVLGGRDGRTSVDHELGLPLRVRVHPSLPGRQRPHGKALADPDTDAQESLVHLDSGGKPDICPPKRVLRGHPGKLRQAREHPVHYIYA
ncbi:MAG: class I SAM-dependent DNA methyltransferase [Thiotrichales bacterium]|nr:class I SAM-dependent DNA methyltransferase [Thiotrichales bacterium]